MNEPALLGDRNEGRGRHLAARRMLPARQRLEADDLAIDARLRLVIGDELAALDRAAQILKQRAAFAQPLVHIGLEEADRTASFRLGAVERGIGVADERALVDAVDRIDGDADAEPDPQPMALDLELAGHRG